MQEGINKSGGYIKSNILLKFFVVSPFFPKWLILLFLDILIIEAFPYVFIPLFLFIENGLVYNYTRVSLLPLQFFIEKSKGIKPHKHVFT
tara:strand:- start:149 stop:418 length:270 start_codon:yes stop_codon:yes gene_type:complete